MKEKRNNLIDIERSKNASMNMGLKSPQFKIQQMGSALEIVLVTGMDCQFMFNETIRSRGEGKKTTLLGFEDQDLLTN